MTHYAYMMSVLGLSWLSVLAAGFRIGDTRADERRVVLSDLLLGMTVGIGAALLVG